jgi:hypothetical protein
VNIWVAMLVLPPLVVGLIGLVLERTVIRFLYGLAVGEVDDPHHAVDHPQPEGDEHERRDARDDVEGEQAAVMASGAGVNIWVAMLVLPPLVVGLIGLVLERTVMARAVAADVEAADGGRDPAHDVAVERGDEPDQPEACCCG